MIPSLKEEVHTVFTAAVLPEQYRLLYRWIYWIVLNIIWRNLWAKTAVVFLIFVLTEA